jgi:murein DD-endopeptidase MepM/ murein hydrolase activator NlpD
MGQTWKLALPFAAILLSGCMPDSPRTVFDWGVNDRLHRPVASTKTYTYQEKKDARAAAQPTSAKRVASSAAITSQPLAPVNGLPPVSGSQLFAWPVTGPLVSDFGATANGGKNDGINISAAMDAPIRASASGTVTYAGDELKNYGNLVLVKHTGGYTTAYAHADRLIVARGDFVSRGQIIGYVGQTGDVSKPQLHFEIRSATTPVNPHSYLAATTASNYTGN